MPIQLILKLPLINIHKKEKNRLSIIVWLGLNPNGWRLRLHRNPWVSGLHQLRRTNGNNQCISQVFENHSIIAQDYKNVCSFQCYIDDCFKWTSNKDRQVNEISITEHVLQFNLSWRTVIGPLTDCQRSANKINFC